MNIVFSCDKNYLKYLKVAIFSILKNAKKTSNFNFKIISNDLSNEDIENIQKLTQIKDFNIELICINKEMFSDFPLGGISKMAVQTYFKYIIPQLLKNEKLALYLDVDVLIREDLEEFYNTAFDDKLAVVVGDFYKRIVELENFLGVEYYFNAGVMLLNLEKMRNQNITKQLFENTILLKNANKLTFHDQCVFNYTLNRKVEFVSPKYNAQLGLFQTIFQKMYAKEVLDEGIKNPSIVHFTTEKKPWLDNCPHPFATEYLLYMSQLNKFYDNQCAFDN